MKISSQEEYGLRCLLRLAQAEDGGQSLTLPEIAAGEGLSVAYTGKLLAVLRQGGLIESVRGRTGGYRLATVPTDIRLGQIFAVLSEPLFDEPSYCERHKGSETAGSCVHLGGCNLRSLWQTLESWMRRAFDQITLADLLLSGTELTDLLRRQLTEAALPPPVEFVPLTVLSRSN